MSVCQITAVCWSTLSDYSREEMELMHYILVLFHEVLNITLEKVMSTSAFSFVNSINVVLIIFSFKILKNSTRLINIFCFIHMIIDHKFYIKLNVQIQWPPFNNASWHSTGIAFWHPLIYLF